MNKIKVLLAEDHAIMRKGLYELIDQEKDMEVIGEASDGKQAIELTAKLNPDVVIMDISMPIINGIQATAKIKENHPNVNVLVFTAYDNDEFIFAILEAKAAGYLLKSEPGQGLLNAIRAVYEGDSVIHSDVMKKILKRLKPEQNNNTSKNKEILSIRELEVIKLGALGLVNKEIADKLLLSDRTIQSHWRNIFVKLSVSSRIEAITYCLKKKWITLDKYNEDE